MRDVNFTKNLKVILFRTIDVILPPRCIFTGEIVGEQGAVAPSAWRDLQFITAPQCDSCGVPFAYQTAEGAQCADCLQNPPHYTRARSALVYDEASKDLILKFKHADQMQAVVSFLPWMMRAGEGVLDRTDIIIPVPLHRGRLIKRKYNQAAVMAAALSRQSGRRWHPFVFKRSRATESQGHKKSAARMKNVKGAFQVDRRYGYEIEGKRVLLVDDVLTTGATVNECAKTLLKAGVKEVNILTLARVVKAS